MKQAKAFAKREIALTDKIRLALLRGDGKIYDKDAQVDVTEDGQVSIKHSDGFSEEAVRNADYGLPGQELRKAQKDG